MTVSNSTYRVSYNGNGSTTSFSIPFYFINNSDILVSKLDTNVTPNVETTLVLGTDYNLSGAGDLSGGTLTTIGTLVSGEDITIERSAQYTQSTDYEPFGRFPAETLEQNIDKLTMLAQQVKSITDRSPTFKKTTSFLNREIEEPEPGEFLKYDLNGNIINGGSTVENNGLYTYPDANAIQRTLNNKISESVSCEDFGCVGDGITNDSANFQKFVDFLKTNKKRGFIPKPSSFYVLNDTIDLTDCQGVVMECETAVDRITQESYFKRISGTGAMFNCDGASQLVLINFSLDGNNLATKGLVLTGNASNRVTQCRFINLNVVQCTTYGLEIGDVAANQWDAAVFINPWISSNAININLAGGNTEQVNVYGGSIAGATTYGLQVLDGGINFYGTQFLSSGTADVYISAPPQHNLNFYACYSEGSTIFLETSTIENANRRCINIVGGFLLSQRAVTLVGLGSVNANIYHLNNMSLNVEGVKGSGGLATVMNNTTAVTYSIISHGNVWGNEAINPIYCANKVFLSQKDNQAFREVGSKKYTQNPNGTYTLIPEQSGIVISNVGTSGGFVVNLPTATVGLEYSFIRSASFVIVIEPNGSEVIRGGGAGKYLSLDSDGASVTLRCVNSGEWEFVSTYGTISYEP